MILIPENALFFKRNKKYASNEGIMGAFCFHPVPDYVYQCLWSALLKSALTD